MGLVTTGRSAGRHGASSGGRPGAPMRRPLVRSRGRRCRSGCRAWRAGREAHVTAGPGRRRRGRSARRRAGVGDGARRGPTTWPGWCPQLPVGPQLAASITISLSKAAPSSVGRPARRRAPPPRPFPLGAWRPALEVGEGRVVGSRSAPPGRRLRSTCADGHAALPSTGPMGRARYSMTEPTPPLVPMRTDDPED